MDYLEKFQKLIDEYNAGSANIEEFFDELVEFAKALNAGGATGRGGGSHRGGARALRPLTKPDRS